VLHDSYKGEIVGFAKNRHRWNLRVGAEGCEARRLRKPDILIVFLFAPSSEQIFFDPRGTRVAGFWQQYWFPAGFYSWRTCGWLACGLTVHCKLLSRFEYSSCVVRWWSRRGAIRMLALFRYARSESRHSM